MLIANGSGLERLKFRNAIATEAGHTSGCERILLESVAEEQRHMVPANRGAMNAHDIYVCDVIHDLEELGLRPRRLCNELMHAMQRGHVRLLSAEIARDVVHNFAFIAKTENQRCIVVGKMKIAKTVKAPNIMLRLWPSCRRLRL